jgi:hypothetical protein
VTVKNLRIHRQTTEQQRTARINTCICQQNTPIFLYAEIKYRGLNLEYLLFLAVWFIRFDKHKLPTTNTITSYKPTL